MDRRLGQYSLTRLPSTYIPELCKTTVYADTCVQSNRVKIAKISLSTCIKVAKITFPLTLTLPCGFLAPPPWQIIIYIKYIIYIISIIIIYV